MKTNNNKIFTALAGIMPWFLIAVWCSIVAILLYHRPYSVWGTLDDYCRAFNSYKWYLKPFLIDPIYIDNSTWLPFHFVINGASFYIYKDIYLVSLAEGLLFSLLTIPAVYLSAKQLFDNNEVALIAVTLMLSLTSFTMLSFSNTANVYFNFTVVLVFYLFLLYKNTGRQIYAVFAFAALAAANTMRPEGWGLSILLILCILLAEKGKDRTAGIILACVTLVFPLMFVYKTYAYSHHIFQFVRPTVKEFAQWYPQSVSKGVPGFLKGRTMLYFRIFWAHHPVFMILSIFSAIYIFYRSLKNNNVIVKAYILIVCGMALILSVSAHFDLSGNTYQVRFLYPWLFLMLPVIAKAIHENLMEKHRAIRIAAISALCVILAFNLAAILEAKAYNFFSRSESAGRELNALFKNNTLKADCAIITEYSFLEYYPLAVHSNNPLNVFTIPDYTDRFSHVSAPKSQVIGLDNVADFVKKHNSRVIFIIGDENFKRAILGRRINLRFITKISCGELYWGES